MLRCFIQDFYLYSTETILIWATKKEISLLIIDFTQNEAQIPFKYTNEHIFLQIFVTTNYLVYNVFRFIADDNIDFYDQLVVPLLRRILNLNKLDLHLIINCSIGFIDGNDLKKNILHNLSQLNQFSVPLNYNIQCTFKDLAYNQIRSCIDYFQEIQYYIYSYPHLDRVIRYHDITEHFVSGLFKSIREILLFDEHSFQNEFCFFRISNSFLSLKKLTVNNNQSQYDKQHRKANDDQNNFIIIQYFHL
ncbi:unnamed protein product [Rotaria sp. Silwood1]|nr:unnamed protein product [Rotaria sp. Silwood1]